MHNLKVGYYTLGCKVNQYDTDSMRTLMEESGFSTADFNGICDIYIVNTCTVTHMSDKKSRQIIRKAHKNNPEAIIIVCGCYAKISRSEVHALDGVSAVLGTGDRRNIVQVVRDCLQKKLDNDTSDSLIFEEIKAVHSDKTRAYLKIQDGCNSFCSYCIIPYARGRIKSRNISNVIDEILRLDCHGFKEVVLTGIHLLSYGADFEEETDICDVISMLKDFSNIQRIRLGSLDPNYIDNKFISCIANNPLICRQFHLSLQSGSDSVLERMNRKYNTARFRSCVKKIRKAMPDCAITTDIIAGFPNETISEHNETLNFIREIGFSRIHVFPYSQRKGTKAADMPNQISKSVKERRANEIIKIGDELQLKFQEKHIGRTVSVLFEEEISDYLRGYTENYIDVHVKNNNYNCYINKIIDVKIIEACSKHLIGTIIE